jgi:hypothetical protein
MFILPSTVRCTHYAIIPAIFITLTLLSPNASSKLNLIATQNDPSISQGGLLSLVSTIFKWKIHCLPSISRRNTHLLIRG